MKPSVATAVFFLSGSLLVAPACSGGASGEGAGADAGAGAAAGVGDPCTPAQEADSSFLGFDEKQVEVETRSAACATGVCLVNHFRGRASCPYGQSADGSAPSGGQPCITTSGAAVTGSASNPAKRALVAPQCVDRAAD